MKKNKELIDLLEDWKFNWNNPNTIYRFGKNEQETEYKLEDALKKANKFLKKTSKRFF